MKSRGKRVLKNKGVLEKNCVICQRPFQWRRKWARDWEHVKYCSDACRCLLYTSPSPRDKTVSRMPSSA